MDQKTLLRSIRDLQSELKELESGYKLGIYSERWYNENVESIKSTIAIKKNLYSTIYDINANI